ncbi:hypothetical protein J2S74_004219 [Evansella vedderi]|uniref:Uncharacterized protein n=1 Tax=Evansella vedderi TaxID=38282 RepID=A0ABU0A1B0_9BACI|nr:hypothetical protein [Evansella vedderi]MDQ0256797.1 hypothetical protein [Evansella vedderi]
MKGKGLSIILFFIIVLGCTPDDQDTVKNIIEGKNIGASYSMNLLTIFVEDNVAGDNLIRVNPIRFDASEYEVEAYKIIVTKETKIILDETGEEISFTDSNLASKRVNSVEVKVEEDFTREVSHNRHNYITFDRGFLPIYRAKEIRILPNPVENFLYFMTTFIPYPHEDGYAVFLAGDPNSEEVQFFDFYQANQALNTFQTSSRRISLINSNQYMIHSNDLGRGATLQYLIDEFELPEEYSAQHLYFVFNHGGLVTHTTDWEEVLQYFQAKYIYN